MNEIGEIKIKESMWTTILLFQSKKFFYRMFIIGWYKEDEDVKRIIPCDLKKIIDKFKLQLYPLL
jgi:hypothetical protein